MPLLALTATYRDSELKDLERVAIARAELDEALACLLRAPDIKEALVLSTCNRTEVYTWAKDPEAAADQIRLFLEDLKHLDIGWTNEHFHVLMGEDVIRHLFRVTAGLDSMVEGETEIQGQVRRAYKDAVADGAIGPHLHGLFRWSLEAGKHTRSATGLSRATDSFPRAAVRAIDATLGGVNGREVVVVGSGRMAVASLRAMEAAGARLGVVARRLDAAEALADRFGAFALPMHALEDAIVAADAVIFATSAHDPLIGPSQLQRVMKVRDGRPLAVVDLGLPRNVAPDLSDLNGFRKPIAIFDLTRLDEEGYTVPGGREAQLGTAAEIVLTESEKCVAWFRSRPADAVVAAIQAQAARVAETEAAAAAKRIPGLDEAQRAAVEQAIRRSVRKVVHTPTVRAKEASARGDDGLLEAARWLFGIEAEAFMQAKDKVSGTPTRRGSR